MALSPFDHIKNLHSKVQWEDLNEEDKKSFNVYIVNKGLSMNPDYLDIVNMAQLITEPRMVYKFYLNVLPNRNKFYKWVKGTKDINKDLLIKLSEYYQVSQREVKDYIRILGKSPIRCILEKYGIEKKEITKLLKGIK